MDDETIRKLILKAGEGRALTDLYTLANLAEEQARADERAKMRGDGWQSYTEDEVKEAYAKGKAEAHTEMYEMGLKDGKKLGQADLVEKLISREVVDNTWVVLPMIKASHNEIEEIVKAAIKKASSISAEIGEKSPKATVSESLGEDATHVSSPEHDANPKPEKCDCRECCGTSYASNLPAGKLSVEMRR